jgi:hypothetical protein
MATARRKKNYLFERAVVPKRPCSEERESSIWGQFVYRAGRYATSTDGVARTSSQKNKKKLASNRKGKLSETLFGKVSLRKKTILFTPSLSYLTFDSRAGEKSSDHKSPLETIE